MSESLVCHKDMKKFLIKNWSTETKFLLHNKMVPNVRKWHTHITSKIIQGLAGLLMDMTSRCTIHFILRINGIYTLYLKRGVHHGDLTCTEVQSTINDAGQLYLKILFLEFRDRFRKSTGNFSCRCIALWDICYWWCDHCPYTSLHIFCFMHIHIILLDQNWFPTSINGNNYDWNFGTKCFF